MAESEALPVEVSDVVVLGGLDEVGGQVPELRVVRVAVELQDGDAVVELVAEGVQQVVDDEQV